MQKCTVVQRNVSESDFAEILRIQRLRRTKEQEEKRNVSESDFAEILRIQRLRRTKEQEEKRTDVSAFNKALYGSKCFLKSRNFFKA